MSSGLSIATAGRSPRRLESVREPWDASLAGRLETALARNHELEEAVAVYASLTRASLAGAELAGLLEELAHILQRDVRLVQDVVAPACIHAQYAAVAEPVAEVMSVAAGGLNLGSLHLGSRPLTPRERQALECGAAILALELVKLRARAEVEWQFQGDLLEGLLGGGSVPDVMAQRAARSGINLDVARRVLVLDAVDGDRLPGLLDHARRTLPHRAGADGVLISQVGRHVVIALSGDDREPSLCQARAVLKRAAQAGLACNGGLSAEGTNLSRGFEQARAAMGFAANLGGGALIDYDELGPMRFLLGVPDVGELHALVRTELGQLQAYDRAEGSHELMSTLRAYVDAGGKQREVCAACHIHINTLKYRLTRIAQLLDCSLTDADQRFRLKLAFEVRDVLMRNGSDPLGPPSPVVR